MQIPRKKHQKGNAMEIQWLGTAGFKLTTADTTLLLDPYLSRNPYARPQQRLTPTDLGPAHTILVSHGHFDHLMDVPAVSRATGADVACSPTAARTLCDMGLFREHITTVDRDGFTLNLNGIRAKAFYSRHVRFDLRLMLSTLARVGRRFREIFPLFFNFPCGRVLSWRIQAEGMTLHFFGSGGSSQAEFTTLARTQTDVLLVPLQGHSRICDLALNYVKHLRPGLVIPHHHDDFYPPVSQNIDIKVFLNGVREADPGIQVRELHLNERLCLDKTGSLLKIC